VGGRVRRDTRLEELDEDEDADGEAWGGGIARNGGMEGRREVGKRKV
jgi:hypothetical protein